MDEQNLFNDISCKHYLVRFQKGAKLSLIGAYKPCVPMLNGSLISIASDRKNARSNTHSNSKHYNTIKANIMSQDYVIYEIYEII